MSYSCNNCGSSDVETSVLSQANCTYDGEIMVLCHNCWRTSTQVIPATGEHNFEIYGNRRNPTCTEDGFQSYRCSVCYQERSESIDALGHDWIETDREEAQIGVDGHIDYECSRCGDTKTEVLNALELDPTPIIDEPIIDEPVVDNPSVSYNDLLIEIRGLREDVQNITNGSVPVRVLNYDDFNNQAEYIVSSNSVSQNIMTTPINEYSLPESLQLITLLALILGGLIYVVRRCIFKWN